MMNTDSIYPAARVVGCDLQYRPLFGYTIKRVYDENIVGTLLSVPFEHKDGLIHLQSAPNGTIRVKYKKLK